MNSKAYQAGYKAFQAFQDEGEEVYPECPFTTDRQAYLRDLWIKGFEAARADDADARVDYRIQNRLADREVA